MQVCDQRRVGVYSLVAVLGRECPALVLAERALCLLTFSYLLIVNKTSLLPPPSSLLPPDCALGGSSL